MWLRMLEKRQSTNWLKELAPPNAISWGVIGMVDRHREESIRFMGPGSTFSDMEIRVLESLRLLLWPTAFRNQVRSEGSESGLCKCGSTQTATHLLLVPQDCTIHSLALRSISKGRHSDGVRELSICILKLDTWKVATMEHVEDPEARLEGVRSAISRARGRRVLSMQSECHNGSNGPQHWKPDGVLGRLVNGKISLLLIDVTFAADDKLAIEDEVLKYWKDNRPPETPVWPPLATDFFDDGGRITNKGMASLPADLQDRARRLSVFHPARYAKRYDPLAKALRSDTSIKWSHKPEVVTIAIGVAGWIPDYTYKGLKRIFNDPKELCEATRALRIVAQSHAVKAWRAFRDDK